MRSPYYAFSVPSGDLLARLQLTTSEAAYRTDITTVEPPSETEDLKAVFDGEDWVLADRYPPPDPAP